MHILFKYPSRSRPERFFDGLNSIVNNLNDRVNYTIRCTLDTDDTTMHNDYVIGRIANYPNTVIDWGFSKSKIDAVNRDMPDNGFDIIVVMSDDMRFIVYGFDQIIRECFRNNAPDGDLYAHFPDQDAKHMLATLYVAGKKYYKRDGYIYHPDYLSLFCDNEAQDVAQIRGKYQYMGLQIVNHLNPAYGHLSRDVQFDLQQGLWNTDEATYKRRKQNNFYLNEHSPLIYPDSHGYRAP